MRHLFSSFQNISCMTDAAQHNTHNDQTAGILSKSFFLTLEITQRLMRLPRICFRRSISHNQWTLELSTTPMRITSMK